MKTHTREKRTICLPFEKSGYSKIVKDSKEFRRNIDEMVGHYPELFPGGITRGYTMKDIRKSKKRQVDIRRIELSINGNDYSIRPSFVMPYMTGFTDDVEKALYLRKYDVPFPALSYVFGHDPMYWYRLENHLGRFSLVGATIHSDTEIPQHLIADEKHTHLAGEKCYIATTIANDCILGVSVANNAGEVELTKAYGVFAEEVKRIKPGYKPKTVNTDGWPATQKTWQTLFPTVLIICCFLHVFIKIRDRTKVKFHEIYLQATTKLWDCYRATTKKSFSQRIRRLTEWCDVASDLPAVISEPIKKLSKNKQRYAAAYDQPGCHRTSNMLDRLMQRMDRHLFSTQYFHGSLSTAELNIRGWALIYNFAPSNPMTVKKYAGLKSPADRLNGFSYHDNWLQNLLISASLREFRPSP
jgi:hypothetical protein